MIFPKSFYDIDFKIVAERLSPPFARAVKFLAWFNSLLTPLQQTRDELFEKYYYLGGSNYILPGELIGLDERLKYNAQTVLFEYILNKHYGVVVAPYIYIVNHTGSLDTVYLADAVSGEPTSYWNDPPNDADTVFIGNESDYMAAYDFTVYVPAALYATLGASNPERDANVQFEVDKYKIIGTNNNIISY